MQGRMHGCRTKMKTVTLLAMTKLCQIYRGGRGWGGGGETSKLGGEGEKETRTCQMREIPTRCKREILKRGRKEALCDDRESVRRSPLARPDTLL